MGFSEINLKIFLAKNNLKQKDLAQKLGINESSLSKKIKGITDFSVNEVGKFIALYGYDNARDIFFAE